MKTFAVLFIALAMAGSVPAQVNYNKAIQQAHNAVNQTEAASQGQQPQSPPPSQSPPPAAAPMDPTLAATLQNIASLRADFDAMSGNFAPKSLTNDLATAAIGVKKASASSVAKLTGDLQTAVTGNDKMRTQHQKLAQDVHALFNSSYLSPVQQQAVESDAQIILQGGGVASDQIAAVLDDLKAVADETK